MTASPVTGADLVYLAAGQDVLAETEFARMTGLMRQLRPEEWQRQTICPLWDIRSLAAHVLGMAEAQASFRQFARDYRTASNRDGGPMIDAMTAAQVRERAALTPAQVRGGSSRASEACRTVS